MAGYGRLYVIGGLGGFAGSDGVNPIEFMVLVGDGNRQWMEPIYVRSSCSPIGKISRMIPARPDDPDSLLDACIAFNPEHFRSCPSLAVVEAALQEETFLDFSLEPRKIPPEWTRLREEARPLFAGMNIWRAVFVPVEMR